MASITDKQAENISSKKINQTNWDYLAKNPHAIRKIIGIVYAGRSGSMMLSGFLDGHSHLISFNYYCDGPLYLKLKELAIRGPVSALEFQTYLSGLLPSIMNAFYEHTLLSPEIKQQRLDLDLLLSEIAHICAHLDNKDLISIDLMLTIIFIAYGKLNDRPLSTTRPIMIVQLHTPSLMDDWRYIFSHLNNFHLLVAVRNPLKAIDSHFFHHTYETLSPPWKDFYKRIMLEYKKSFLPFLDPEMAHKASSIAFEDLHEKLEHTMRSLCQHMDIPFESVLLQETLGGQPSALISTGQTRSGPSVARARDKTLKMLGKSDQAFIEYLFKDVILALDYELTSNRFMRIFSRYLPTKLEWLFFKKEVVELKADRSYGYKNENELTQIFLDMFALHSQTSEMKIDKNKISLKINKIKPIATI